nr:MAG TPA: hypothetical protein [Caudoviricetes sp.]
MTDLTGRKQLLQQPGQRHLEGKKCTWFDPCIKPSLASLFTPWGQP